MRIASRTSPLVLYGALALIFLVGFFLPPSPVIGWIGLAVGAVGGLWMLRPDAEGSLSLGRRSLYCAFMLFVGITFFLTHRGAGPT